MRSRIRPRLNHATVVAYLALFVALGGGSYAAVKINGKSIKNKSIAGTKLKNRTVSGGKVRKDTLTGTEINESKLGTVPLARQADTATTASNATTAGSAENASTLDGVDSSGFLRNNGGSVVKINSRQAEDATAETILELAGLKLQASCPVPGGVKVVATTSKDDSSLYAYAAYPPNLDFDSFDLEGGDFDTGTSVDLGTELGDLGAPRVGALAYEAPDGSVVTVQFAGDFNGTSKCVFTGTAIGG